LKPEIRSRRNRFAIPRNCKHECLHFTERPYFVSTLGLEPEPFLLNNWHVQPICQRPNRFPPERCAFSPEQITRMRICLSSKPFKTTALVAPLSTLGNHRTSTTFAQL